MGTINGINAKAVSLESPSETSKRKKYFLFGVFFDGTGNDMTQNFSKEVFKNTQKARSEQFKKLQENNGSNTLMDAYSNEGGDDYSNIALLHSCYQGMKKEEKEALEAAGMDVYMYNLYTEGPGTTGSLKTTLEGSAAGVGDGGVVSLVKATCSRIRNVIKSKATDFNDVALHFHVFGFSRGAACARLFSYLAVRSEKENLSGIDNYNNYYHFLDDLKCPIITVDFLGLFDTVSSIGYDVSITPNDVDGYGLFVHPNGRVKSAFHLCALDEFRRNFALTDLGAAVAKDNFSEFFIPGCHTDIGGTYVSATRHMIIRGTNYLYKQLPHTSSKGYVKINKELLQELGWFSEEEKQNTAGNKLKDTWEINNFTNNHIIDRYVKQGYNLIPFKLMRQRTLDVTKKQTFGKVGNTLRFTLPNDLTNYYKEISGYVQAKTKGRYWYYTGGQYNSKKYQWLRSHYLNYSADDSYYNSSGSVKDVPNGYIFAPSTKDIDVPDPAKPGKTKTDNVMARRIVRGNQGSKGYIYLCDYQ